MENMLIPLYINGISTTAGCIYVVDEEFKLRCDGDLIFRVGERLLISAKIELINSSPYHNLSRVQDPTYVYIISENTLESIISKLSRP